MLSLHSTVLTCCHPIIMHSNRPTAPTVPADLRCWTQSSILFSPEELTVSDLWLLHFSNLLRKVIILSTISLIQEVLIKTFNLTLMFLCLSHHDGSDTQLLSLLMAANCDTFALNSSIRLWEIRTWIENQHEKESWIEYAFNSVISPAVFWSLFIQ